MVTIAEFLPNPQGSDTAGEYITLENTGTEIVALTGWRVKDAQGKTFALQGTIAPQARLVLSSTKTKLTLNNNGETVMLLDSTGTVVDTLGYTGTAGEGEVIAQGVARAKAASSSANVSPQATALLEPRAIVAPPYPNIASPSQEPFWGVAILVGLLCAGISFFVLKSFSRSV